MTAAQVRDELARHLDSIAHPSNRRRPKSPQEARPSAGSRPFAEAEPLERRRHLTVTASISGGVVSVTGDSAANTINIYRTVQAGISDKIFVEGDGTTLNSFDNSTVTRIDVYGGAGL